MLASLIFLQNLEFISAHAPNRYLTYDSCFQYDKKTFSLSRYKNTASALIGFKSRPWVVIFFYFHYYFFWENKRVLIGTICAHSLKIRVILSVTEALYSGKMISRHSTHIWHGNSMYLATALKRLFQRGGFL